MPAIESLRRARAIYRRLAAIAAVAAAASPLVPQAATAGRIFTWVDEAGNLHATDRLANVPEPYFSMYRAQELARKEKAKVGQQTSPTVRPVPRRRPPARRPARPGAGLAAREEASRKRWRDKVNRWRGELAAATAKLQKIDSAIATANSNPLLAQTPQVKSRLAVLSQQRATVMLEVNGAREMLLKKIPEQARRAGVPRRWLD